MACKYTGFLPAAGKGQAQQYSVIANDDEADDDDIGDDDDDDTMTVLMTTLAMVKRMAN